MEINDTLRNQVKDFVESPAGQFYIAKLNLLIEDNHTKSENSPELSRDHAQAARGVRQARDELIGLSIVNRKEGRKR